MLAPLLLLSKRFARWGVIFGVLGVPAPASSQSIVTDLSTREVAISTGFTGAELLLFGATEGFGDIVVTVVGPKRDEIIRRKERVAGIWVNGTSVTFENAPAYYRTAASKPLSEIAAPEVLEKLQIGSSRIDLSTRSSRGAEAILEFREAFIRSKKRQALYSEDISDIKITRGRLFRSTIPFPVNVPIGTYEVTVHLFKDGRLVSSEKTPLTVQKVGLEAQIYDFAHDHAAWYGLIAIAIALVAGWLAGVIFRRA
ncbi:MAG: TIGR02186 family protein [Rhodospirillaceae bacterium]|nr:TIGR02186 family protein [Rhodospirillaceae bacterium]